MGKLLWRISWALWVAGFLFLSGCTAREPSSQAGGSAAADAGGLRVPLGVSLAEQGDPDFYRQEDAGFTDAPVKLSMRMPESGACYIMNVLHDGSSGSYAVLYADQEEKMTRVQLFDARGGFLWDYETGVRAPYGGDVAYDVAIFENGVVAFQEASREDGQRIFIDMAGGGVQHVPAALQCAAEDGRETALFGVHWDEGERAYIGTMSLVRENSVAGKVTFSADRTFALPENRVYSGEPRLVFTFDARTRNALLGNDKVDYKVDFGAGTVETVYHYTESHLDKLLAVSADGRKMIYKADSGGAGDSNWADLVVRDAETGAIRRLSDENPQSLAFGPGHLLATENVSYLAFYDTGAAQPADFTLQFDHGTAQSVEDTVLVTLGIAYDTENACYLLAYRDGHFAGESGEAVYPVSLDVFDGNGEKLRTVETGLSIPAYTINWVLRVSIELLGDGRARLSTPEEEGYEATVGYRG